MLCYGRLGTTVHKQAMALEYAFFAAQSQWRTVEDDRPAEVEHTEPVVADDVTYCTAGESDVIGARLTGVHDRVALLCVDFDDTLTDGDTTSLLVKTAQAQVRCCDCAGGVCSLDIMNWYWPVFAQTIDRTSLFGMAILALLVYRLTPGGCTWCSAIPQRVRRRSRMNGNA